MAFAELREAIVMGEIAPGTALRLGPLAELLGMSVQPVSDAVQLESQGLVEATPYRGARVSAVSAADMAEIYDVREALERPAARRAAARFGDRDGERLRTILAGLAAAYARADIRSIVRSNSPFHAALAEISGLRILSRLLQPTLEASERFSAAILLTGEISETVRQIEERGHVAILDACERGDPDAAQLSVHEHLRSFEELFVGRREAAS